VDQHQRRHFHGDARAGRRRRARQSGPGKLLLTNTNALAGQNNVTNGVLASTQTSGAPFGTGTRS
jgi:hypothetical protein